MAAFTVMVGAMADDSVAIALTEEFAARIGRFAAQQGYAVASEHNGPSRTIGFGGAEVPFNAVLRLVGNTGDRWEWQLWTVPRVENVDWPRLMPYHRQLVELVIAWQETEDVDAVINVDAG